MNQEKIDKFIAKNRKNKNLTQSELAEKLGVTNRLVSNWENGKNMPDITLIKEICKNINLCLRNFTTFLFFVIISKERSEINYEN